MSGSLDKDFLGMKTKRESHYSKFIIENPKIQRRG